MTDYMLNPYALPYASNAAAFMKRIADRMSQRHVALGMLGLAVTMQVLDAGMDVTAVYETGQAHAADLIGVGDFVTGCIAAVLLKR